MDNTSSSLGEEDPSNPIVFQCSKCHLIVGDSFSFHSVNPELQTMTLFAASNIKRIPELFTSYCGHDIGSTYINFKCSGCQLPLGKFYLTTSCDMDDAREVFTFDADKVTSVQLGNAHHGKLKYPQAVTSSTENNVNAVLLATTQALQDLKDEVQKMQIVMFGLADRVKNLENKRWVEEASTSPPLSGEVSGLLLAPNKISKRQRPNDSQI